MLKINEMNVGSYDLSGSTEQFYCTTKTYFPGEIYYNIIIECKILDGNPRLRSCIDGAISKQDKVKYIPDQYKKMHIFDNLCYSIILSDLMVDKNGIFYHIDPLYFEPGKTYIGHIEDYPDPIEFFYNYIHDYDSSGCTGGRYIIIKESDRGIISKINNIRTEGSVKIRNYNIFGNKYIAIFAEDIDCYFHNIEELM